MTIILRCTWWFDVVVCFVSLLDLRFVLAHRTLVRGQVVLGRGHFRGRGRHKVVGRPRRGGVHRVAVELRRRNAESRRSSILTSLSGKIESRFLNKHFLGLLLSSLTRLRIIKLPK